VSKRIKNRQLIQLHAKLVTQLKLKNYLTVFPTARDQHSLNKCTNTYLRTYSERELDYISPNTLTETHSLKIS